MNHILIITVCALGVSNAFLILVLFGVIWVTKRENEDLKCMLFETYSGKKNIKVPKSIRDTDLFKFMLQCDSVTVERGGTKTKHIINSEGEDV